MTGPVVLACGLATVDVIQTVDHVPSANEKVVAVGTRVEAGGPALNAAVTAALLGLPARLVTAVGGSALGRVVLDDCATHGVVVVDTAREGFVLPVSTVLVTVSTGERAVASRNSVGSTPTAVLAAERVDEALDGVTAVLVDGHHLPVAMAVAAAARERGIPVLADGGSSKPGLEGLLAHVDVLVVSDDFRRGTDDGEVDLRDLLGLGPRWVARTAGGDPVRWLAADGSSGSVPVRPTVVVDTLGAGDVLHGALVADIAQHGTGDLPASLARSVALATMSVAAHGARGWAPVTALRGS